VGNARRALGAVTLVWLLCEAMTFAIVPAALWMETSAANIAECTCAHGPDAACPMHRQPSANPPMCVMRSVSPNDAVLLNTLLGVAGFLPAPAHRAAEMLALRSAPIDQSSATTPHTPPDPPPPRA